MTEIEKRILLNQKVIMDTLLTIIIAGDYKKGVDSGMAIVGAINETSQLLGEIKE